jgi:hypothetical protein
MTKSILKKVSLLTGSIALAALLMFALLPSLRPVPTLAYTATVRVEINPAFDIIVDENDLVVDIIALNDDALGFDKTPYIGVPIEEAIDALIAYAIEAGFIDEEYIESDVVKITLITEDDEEEDEEVKERVDNLGKRIEDYLADKEEGTEVDVVFIKATLRELFEAEGKEIPFGLYVINGKVLQEDGTYIPVREVKSNGRGRPEVDEDDDDEEEVKGNGRGKGRDKDRPEVDEDDDDKDLDDDLEDEDEEEDDEE